MRCWRKIKKGILLGIPFVLLLGCILFPIYWAFNTSLKSESDILKVSVEYFPSAITVENFVEAWNRAGFARYFFNSFKISVISVCVISICSIMVGYALSRYQFKGKTLFMLALLATQFIPQAVLLIPLFRIFNSIHLINTHLSLIIVDTAFQLPFACILMRGFISGIPVELEEAAMIDGCSRRQGVFKVVLPVLLPGIVTVAAFAFVGCWNEFLFSLMFLNDPAKYTIPVGLKMMQGQFSVKYGLLSAGAMIAMSVPVLMFAYLQKYLVSGLGSGAVKG